MIRWLRRLIAPELALFTARLERLEAEEAARERVTREQLDQLRLYWKRLRTRDARLNPEEEEDGEDEDLLTRTLRLTRGH